MFGSDELRVRAERHAALGDPVRLSILDILFTSDVAPVELRHRLGIESNLLAHHLDVLERVGLIERSRSSGDGRRRYVHLRHEVLDDFGPHRSVSIGPALFVCTADSARSQLAAALWRARTGQAAISAGTRPAERVHPRARDAARRVGIDLGEVEPRHVDDVATLPELVVTVCDRAHEDLEAGDDWLHWSVPDPIASDTVEAFDETVRELQRRIDLVAAGTDSPG